MSKIYLVKIRRLLVDMFIGVHEHEKRSKQRVAIDVELELELQAVRARLSLVASFVLCNHSFFRRLSFLIEMNSMTFKSMPSSDF